MKMLLGFFAGLYAAQVYSKPLPDSTHRPSYVALRDELYKPVCAEISKKEDRHVLKTVGSGVKAYVKSLFS